MWRNGPRELISHPESLFSPTTVLTLSSCANSQEKYPVMNTWLCSTSDTPALNAIPAPSGINTAAARRPSPDGDLRAPHVARQK